MLIDLSPLRKSGEFRLLYTGQTVSLLGSMLTYVAIPYQVSSFRTRRCGSACSARFSSCPSSRRRCTAARWPTGFTSRRCKR